MKRILTLAAQIMLVAASVFAADFLQSRIDFIPRWLVHLPGATYSRSEFWVVLKYFVATHVVVLGLVQLVLGAWRPSDARRTVDELFALAAAFAASALLVFVTTTVSFDPQFMVGIAMCTMLAHLAIHAVAAAAAGRLGSAAGALLRALLRRTFSVAGVLALLFALSPAILAKLFVSNRDVANVVTQIRIRTALSGDHDWEFVNALGGATFKQPILVQFPPHRDDRVYVLERGGRLLRMNWHEPGEAEVVLDISDKVGYVEVENGALGFDFHPAFGRSDSPNASHIFLYYTAVHDGQQVNRLSRFSLAPAGLAERSASEETLIRWDRRNDGFHNGGSVEFGPDGFLYVAVGEMSNVPSHQSVSRALVSGILRIDVDRRGGTVSRPIARQPEDGRSDGYYIPVDNPFADRPDALGEFWALGLRNPFRISFDPRDGALWVGEVGSSVWEEVNLVRKGHNYQFPFVEGREETGKQRPQTVIGVEAPPVYTYRHTAYDRAVIGGVVYRGARHPALQGAYVFGDNYSGRIMTFPATGEAVDAVRDIARANQYAQRGIASFAVSPDGELLVTTLGRASGRSGEVLKLVAEGGGTVATEPAPPEPAVTEAEAQNLYRTNCGRCHGAEGAGDGPDAGQMNVPMPDLRSAEFHLERDDQRIYAVIRDGGAAHGLSAMMPPWGQLLTEKELSALVELVRSLRRD